MGIFYLLHEYTERYHPDFPIGKKFARTAILGFIFYYILYFILPLWEPLKGKRDRIQHFLKYMVVVDIMASSIFYGGFLNSVSFWSTGKSVKELEDLEDVGITCGQWNGNPSYELRQEPQDPQVVVSPWLSEQKDNL